MHWITAWLELIEGFINIFLFGITHVNLSYRFTIWHMIREAAKKRHEEWEKSQNHS